MKTIAVYVRVSTQDQSTERQRLECQDYITRRGLGEVTIYADSASGTKANRTAFQAMLKACRQGKHSTIVVQKLDRFSRSLSDLVGTLQTLKELNVGFISIGDDLDLTTAAGKLLFHVIGAIGEFESSLISHRVRSGMTNAKRKGIHLGRPKLVIDPDKVRRLAQTQSYREVAKTLGISLGSVARIMKAA